MGILGLYSVNEFSDRLFNSFDLDDDGKVHNIVKLDFFSRLSLIHGSAKMRRRDT
jgi:hypothetical protein